MSSSSGFPVDMRGGSLASVCCSITLLLRCPGSSRLATGQRSVVPVLRQRLQVATHCRRLAIARPSIDRDRSNRSDPKELVTASKPFSSSILERLASCHPLQSSDPGFVFLDQVSACTPRLKAPAPPASNNHETLRTYLFLFAARKPVPRPFVLWRPLHPSHED